MTGKFDLATLPKNPFLSLSMRYHLSIFLSVFVLCSWSTAAEEITSKKLKLRIIEVPDGRGGILVKDEITGRGYYRNDTLILEERVVRPLIVLGKVPEKAIPSRTYVIFARGKEIIHLSEPNLRATTIQSPWPMWVENRSVPRKEHKHTWLNICIPEINFYEYVEFHDEKLQPLLTDNYEGMKDTHMKIAVKALKK